MVKYLQLESSMGSHCVGLTKMNVSHKIKTIIGWLMPKSANKILLTTHWPPFFFQVRVGKCDLRFARQSRHVQIQHVTYCHLRLLKSYFPCTLLCVMYSSFVNFGPHKTWITGNLKAKVFLYLCYGIACHGSMGRLTFQMYDVGYHTLPAQFHLDHESSNLQSSIGSWNTSLRRSFQIIWGFNNVFGKHCQDPLNV